MRRCITQPTAPCHSMNETALITFLHGHSPAGCPCLRVGFLPGRASSRPEGGHTTAADRLPWTAAVGIVTLAKLSA